MPQDIPVEASEELVFTPASFLSLGDAAPTFTLRAATERTKRFLRRLQIEEGIVSHPVSAFREEVLNGLKQLWSPEQFDQHSVILKDYWDARDDYEQQEKVYREEAAATPCPDPAEPIPPFPPFAYDPEIEQACKTLERKIIGSWPPLLAMVADNQNSAELLMPSHIAVIVKSWTGLDLKLPRERGYLTVDGAERLVKALAAFERQNGLAEGVAMMELFVACTKRMYLDEEEAKNSASPSLSESSPAISNPTSTSDTDGSSPESTARSSETPVTA